MPDTPRRVRDALLHGSLTRRAGAVAGAAALLAVAIGIVVGVAGPGSSRGASSSSSAVGTTTVQRRDLIATDTQSGTLSYADPQTVYNRLGGTITELPAVGTVIKSGQTLYKIDNSPVVLFNGTVPAYRDLSPSATNGPDVKELNQNLVSLGFAQGQITVNDTWQAGTTAAVDRWQASLGETQTGTVTLGQIVFLPGPQRIAKVDSVLGSTGGGASSSTAGTSSGTASGASFTAPVPRAEFVSLTTASTVKPSRTTASQAASRSSIAGSPTKCTNPSGHSPTAPHRPGCPSGGSGSGGQSGGGGSKGAKSAQNAQLQALLALLKAETAALRSSRSTAGTSSSGGAGRSSGSAGGGGTGSGASGSSSGGNASGGSAGSGAASAQPILGTTSTKLVVSVQLDATKQSEALVGEPVTVQMPDGSTVDGRITVVSPVAQTTSSSSSSTGGGSGSSSSASSTIPVTIALHGRTPTSGLDQAAVSINFQQQKATNVLSVPVAALLATAGGGYAVQGAQAPHQLIPVTTGLFAAGYVEISGANIYPGLRVTDSQG